MTARLESIQHSVALFGAVVFTAAMVLFSTTVIPAIA